jgi:hypothetical protein
MDWISVKDRLPDNGKKVLFTYKNRLGNDRILVGYRVERSTVEVTGEYDEYCEYHEEDDCFYSMPGWYEQQENWDDYASIFVHDGEPTHWMPLPQPPKGK